MRALGALFRRPRVSPTKTLGVAGVSIHGGFINDGERRPDLSSRESRYTTYGNILADTSIVAAGTRYFLNLVAKAQWSFTPAEEDADGRFSELAEQALTEDPRTPWHRIVRRAAMYRFYGFSVQEWTARRRQDDGVLTFADIAPRAQSTIDRWDVDETGAVLGVLQRSPQSQQEIYLPREKIVYLVDDSLNDSPEGLGLFRHLVSPAARLTRYEQLEGFGFETDLRQIPIIRAPLAALADKVKAGDMSEAEVNQVLAPLQTFAQSHVRDPKLGAMLDSMVYETKDDAGRPSNVPQWNIELLKGSSTSFKENAAAIERLNRELARILGVEHLLLGSDSSGSFALSRDKTSSFFLLVDGALTEIREQIEDDLLKTMWRLNGWPEETIPEVKTEAVRFTDVEQIGATLRDMATAGAVIGVDDPVVGEVRELMGLSSPPERDEDLDAALVDPTPPPEDPEEMPEEED